MQGHKVGNFMTPNDILTLDLHLDMLRHYIKKLMGKRRSMGLGQAYLGLGPTYVVNREVRPMYL